MKRYCTMLLLLVVSAPFPGCSGEAAGPAQAQKQDVESLLDTVKAALREDRPTVAGYRNAIQQLNTYLDQKAAGSEQYKLDAAARDLLANQILMDVRGTQAGDFAKRLQDVEGPSFTLVD